MHVEDFPPLAHVALLHYQFEAIHPFLDGNGRVGRLLITLYLCARGVMDIPLLYLSAFFEATRRDYYERLRGVTERGEWENWLEYFFNGVARQSEDALSRALRINQLLADWHKAVAQSGSPAPGQIVDLLAGNPFLTLRSAEKKLAVAYNTVARAVTVLEKRGIVELVGERKRDRVFCARAILNILEEPAWTKLSGTNHDSWAKAPFAIMPLFA
jgi:Fic family protein